MALLELDPDQLLSTTRAVRKRLDFARPVPGPVIRECVAMALQAPSGSNVVTMRFVVVRDEQKRRAIGGIYRKVYARYKASPFYPGRPGRDAERDRVQRRVASSADYLGEHMGTRRCWCSAATRAPTGPRPWPGWATSSRPCGASCWPPAGVHQGDGFPAGRPAGPGRGDPLG